MKYIKFKLDRHRYYPEESNCKDLRMLGAFFRSDVGCDISSFKDFLLDQGQEDTASNFSFLEKEGNNIVIGCLYSEDPYEWTFETTIKQLIEILDQWEKLCKLEPQEIIITREGDSITLEGKDFPKNKK